MSYVPTIGAWCRAGYQWGIGPYVARPRNVKIIERDITAVFTLEALRQQCEITPTEETSDGEVHPDDDLLLDIAAAAVGYCEDFTGLALVPGIFEIALDAFPNGGIEIPLPPLVEIVSFVAGEDSDGPVDAAAYIVDDYRMPAVLRAVSTWPGFTPSPNGIKLRFAAGYGNDSDRQPMPAQIRRAIMLLVGDWYEHREDSAENVLINIPNGVKSLLRPRRVRLGMA